MNSKTPTDIKIHKRSRTLELVYGDTSHQLPFEFLRVHSPSAEVRGHGKGQEVLQFAKRNINIIGIEPIGSYAIRIQFDDGHDSGFYSWVYLDELIQNQDKLWHDYLEKLETEGKSRDETRAGYKVVQVFNP